VSWPRRAVACALVLAAVVLGSASPAHAHARLLSATPAPGSTAASAPTEIRLTFDGPPYGYGLGVVVLTAAGKHVESGRVRVDGDTVVQPLGALPAPGTYTVRWRVVSVDGHPVSGQYAFGYQPDGSTVTPAPVPGATGAGGGAHGWLLLALAGLAVVGLTALLVVPRRRHSAADAGAVEARGTR
jgi:methionine-rich copper-binding protein CopC